MIAPQISAVVPAFNEEDVVEASLAELAGVLGGLTDAWEIVCVNDGSRDRTGELLDAAAERDPRIRAVHLSRNFGKEAAVSAGLDTAAGQVVVLLDADSQHPPDLIPQMVGAWRDGADVVEARKRSRGREGLIYKAFAAVYYRLFGRLTGLDLRGSADYQLLDRQAVDALQNMPERARFFRGLSNWVGFRRSTVEFDVRERPGGRSGWSMGGLIKYALNSIFSFSTVPLQFATFAGVLAVVFAAGLSLQTLYRWLNGTAVDGFTTVIVANAFLSGVLLVCFGVMSTYLARVLEEVKHRPTYVIRREPAPRQLTAPSTAPDDDD